MFCPVCESEFSVGTEICLMMDPAGFKAYSGKYYARYSEARFVPFTHLVTAEPRW